MYKPSIYIMSSYFKIFQISMVCHHISWYFKIFQIPYFTGSPISTPGRRLCPQLHAWPYGSGAGTPKVTSKDSKVMDFWFWWCWDVDGCNADVASHHIWRFVKNSVPPISCNEDTPGLTLERSGIHISPTRSDWPWSWPRALPQMRMVFIRG